MTAIENTTTHDFWQLHIAQWQASGLSQASYCRQHTLHTHQFSYWKGKVLSDRKPVKPDHTAGFARVQVATHVALPASSGLSLYFRDGAQLTGITQDNLALTKQLIEVLR
jgi:hypothetical protein